MPETAMKNPEPMEEPGNLDAIDMEE